jgi:hypothetical protein
MTLSDIVTLTAYVAAFILLPLYGILVLMKKGKRND